MISYIKGDATIVCKTGGVRVIAHVCNNAGGFGSGFAGYLYRKWPVIREKYKEWYNSLSHTKVKRVGTSTQLPLGEIQVVPVKDEHGTIFVVNMIAQHRFASDENPVALRYLALASCLKKLDEWIKSYKITKEIMVRPNLVGDVSVHMPRIGCGLAGGSWDKVELLIDTMLFEHEVFVYDFKKDAPFGRK